MSPLEALQRENGKLALFFNQHLSGRMIYSGEQTLERLTSFSSPLCKDGVKLRIDIWAWMLSLIITVINNAVQSGA